MLATALSASLVGIDASLVRVEVEAERQVPTFELVGLAEAAVRESRVRVKSALAQVGVDISEMRIVVNLAPADLKKTGSAFDLAIAVATLVAMEVISPQAIAKYMFLGELSLGGELHPVRGLLPQLMGGRAKGVLKAVIPKRNEEEAAMVQGMDIFAIESLTEWVDAMRDDRALTKVVRRSALEATVLADDFSEVKGQYGARRAAEIAAAGAHNLLMVGPPGAGKTMIARRIAGILPPLALEEALTVTAIHSVAGLTKGTVVSRRPFRSPHHTVSEIGLVGGGEWARPGEVSLAHHGVLFLDELPEFRRAALEALRQPLEDGSLTIARAQSRATYPAEIMMVAAMNPCPCGYLGSPRCDCSDDRARKYLARLSGPLFDRIDIHVSLPPLDVSPVSGTAESSERIRERVLKARSAQASRFQAGIASANSNARLRARDLEHICNLGDGAQRLLTRAVSSMGLSARAHGRILRVARTIADLDGEPSIADAHIAEAVGLRFLDRRVKASEKPGARAKFAVNEQSKRPALDLVKHPPAGKGSNHDGNHC